jgi:hypothetical protein
MTQIIAALTPDYVLLASDRQLTAVHGAHKGQRVHDDTCKLVSVCNIFGIGYTGWAEVGGKPTHEWIALQLAEVACVTIEAPRAIFPFGWLGAAQSRWTAGAHAACYEYLRSNRKSNSTARQRVLRLRPSRRELERLCPAAPLGAPKRAGTARVSGRVREGICYPLSFW